MIAMRSSGPYRWLLAGIVTLIAAAAGLGVGPALRGRVPVGGDRSGPQAGGSRPQATFKVEISYVEVTARVTDEKGRVVGDLRKEDFQLFEEGAPQAITNFTVVNVGTPEAAATSGPDVEPDVQSNIRPFEGRLYVLVLDDLNVEPALSTVVRRSARRFIERYMAEGDMAAVVNTTGRAEGAQELTTSRSQLLAAVERFMGRQGNVEFTVPDGKNAVVADVLSSLRAVTDLLEGVRGRRKAVVYFSEGPSFCLGSRMFGGMFGELNKGAQSVVDAASRANVAIYSIDPRGLDPSIGDCAVDEGIQSLRSLSEGTGGFALVNSNDLDGGFDRIRRETSNYYVLGYYPATRGAEGAFRKIEVKTSRPGLDVQARRGYVVPPPRPTPPVSDKGASPVLRDAMNNVLPVQGLRVSGLAAPFKGSGAKAAVTVAVLVDGRDLTFTPHAGSFAGSLELVIATMNARGEAGASEHSLVELPLKAETHAMVAREGLRIVRTLALKPGHYQLRIGAKDGHSDRTGVIHCDVEVPDFESLPFSMSGLLVSSSLAGRVPTAPGGPLDALEKYLPGPPTLSREFRAGEQLALYAEVYGRRSVPGDLIVLTTVVGDDGREFYRRRRPAKGDDWQPNRGAGGSGRAAVVETVSLEGAKPGRYVLRVEARSRTDQKTTASRAVPFRIVP